MKEKENASTLKAFKAFVAQFASGENNVFCGYEHAKKIPDFIWTAAWGLDEDLISFSEKGLIKICLLWEGDEQNNFICIQSFWIFSLQKWNVFGDFSFNIFFFKKRNNFIFLFIGLAEGILTCFQNVKKKIESWESPLENFENLLLGAEEILLEYH